MNPWLLLALAAGSGCGVAAQRGYARWRRGRVLSAVLNLRRCAAEHRQSLRTRGERDVAALRAFLRTRLHEARASLEAPHAELHSTVASLETDLAGRAATLTAAWRACERRQAELHHRQARLRRRRAQCAGAEAALWPTMAQLAGCTRRQALAQLCDARLAEARLAAQKRAHIRQSATPAHASAAARRLMDLAMQRNAAAGHVERLQNSLCVASKPALEALIDPHGAAAAAWAEHTGGELQVDPAAQTLTVRGEDPVAREVGRRLLQLLSLEPSARRVADRLAPLAHAVRGHVEREALRAGRQAVRLLGMPGVHPDIVALLGRLKFRLSYSQNQWKHALEVAYLAGMMAAELGLDAAQARRGGLLHDIGKALTHEREGSHAVLGAAVARRCGESETVANAIGAHHHDEEPTTPIAYLVAAADALSGARPGARREAINGYAMRIDAIGHLAGAMPQVRRVEVMGAGREVRVMVAGPVRGAVPATAACREAGVADAALYPLAQNIARKLEEEVVFAGQIRVTVIREARAVAIAR